MATRSKPTRKPAITDNDEPLTPATMKRAPRKTHPASPDPAVPAPEDKIVQMTVRVPAAIRDAIHEATISTMGYTGKVSDWLRAAIDEKLHREAS